MPRHAKSEVPTEWDVTHARGALLKSVDVYKGNWNEDWLDGSSNYLELMLLFLGKVSSWRDAWTLLLTSETTKCSDFCVIENDTLSLFFN